MSYFQKPHFQTSLDNNMIKYITPKNKSLINFRYTRSQFCPFQKYVDHRPNPYRPLTKSSSSSNLFNHPIEKEKYISCYKFMDKKKLYPLVTRNDLLKYFKRDGTLLLHKIPCHSCNKINQGNYGRNYYSIIKKSFPFIKGNFVGDLNQFFPRYKTPISSRNLTNKIKNKFFQDISNKYNNNYTTEEKNTDKNTFRKIYDMEQKEERKNEKENEVINKNENRRYIFLSRNASSNYFYRPVIRKSFHKTQIFDHCKPYLVDEFKEYGDYK